MATAPTTFDSPELNTGHFYFTEFQKNENSLRCFITNKDKTAIYIKSPKLFIQSITDKHLNCDYIDDRQGDNLKDLLKDLERVGTHFIQRNLNEQCIPVLPAWEGKVSLTGFLKSTPNSLQLIRTNTLRVKNFDNNDINPDELHQRCARVIFSPVCLDIDTQSGEYQISYYAFTAKEFSDEKFVPPQVKSSKIPDFGDNPFV
jgi:hypothetical protein